MTCIPHRVQARSTRVFLWKRIPYSRVSEQPFVTSCTHESTWKCDFVFSFFNYTRNTVGREKKKNIPKYKASTKESHLWNLLRQLNCEDHCWRGYKWSLGHFVPFVQRSNSSWWGIKNFSKDYYGLEGFEISVILEKFIVCSFDQSELRVYWAADSCETKSAL